MGLFQFKVTRSALIIIVSLYTVTFLNDVFNVKLLDWILGSTGNYLYLSATYFLHFLIYVTLLSLIAHNRYIKYILAIFLFIAAISGYFIDTYNVIIDEQMLFNILETNINEAGDLLSLALGGYLLAYFFIPLYLINKCSVIQTTWQNSLKSQIKMLITGFLLIVITLYSLSPYFISFFREQKEITSYVNPLKTIGAIRDLIAHHLIFDNPEHQRIALDAKLSNTQKKPVLNIFIVGETVRADHLSLNGYSKNTNPLLSQQEIVNFSNVSSCATLTRLSLPCMFGIDERDSFDVDDAKFKDNVLDILQRAGVFVLWKDNNSSSKHVATRVNYESYLKPQRCNPECRDIELLNGLEEHIASNKGKNMIFLLHSMGSHGPAYYKRVPDEFKKFTPICETNQLESCSIDELRNSYDNTILYADYFINSAIEFVKKYSDEYQTSVFYVSDHGESLGEDGLFLHGLPYAFAPKNQTHVPLIFWADDYSEFNYDNLKKKSHLEYSHDNIFHTLLGLFGVETEVYKKSLDLLSIN